MPWYFLLALTVLVLAYVVYRRRPRPLTAIPDADPEPVCGCGHNIAYHDLDAGECGEPMKVPVKWKRGEFGAPEPTHWEARPCACRRYTGPQPLPTFYAPEVADLPSPPIRGAGNPAA
jgi:hypothetical protein